LSFDFGSGDANALLKYFMLMQEENARFFMQLVWMMRIM